MARTKPSSAKGAKEAKKQSAKDAAAKKALIKSKHTLPPPRRRKKTGSKLPPLSTDIESLSSSPELKAMKERILSKYVTVHFPSKKEANGDVVHDFYNAQIRVSTDHTPVTKASPSFTNGLIVRKKHLPSSHPEHEENSEAIAGGLLIVHPSSGRTLCQPRPVTDPHFKGQDAASNGLCDTTHSVAMVCPVCGTHLGTNNAMKHLLKSCKLAATYIKLNESIRNKERIKASSDYDPDDDLYVDSLSRINGEIRAAKDELERCSESTPNEPMPKWYKDFFERWERTEEVSAPAEDVSAPSEDEDEEEEDEEEQVVDEEEDCDDEEDLLSGLISPKINKKKKKNSPLAVASRKVLAAARKQRKRKAAEALAEEAAAAVAPKKTRAAAARALPLTLTRSKSSPPKKTY